MSKYVLKQYNKKNDDNTSNFMVIPEEAEEAQAVTVGTEINIGVNNLGSSFIMEDEALQMNFKPGNHYYFHGRIRKMTWTQKFDIKLYNEDENAEVRTQYIKTITVEIGNDITKPNEKPEENWVDVEFIFTPQFTFTHLVFQMYRDSQDFLTTTFSYGRPAVLAYQEVSVIKNIINTVLGIPETGLIKIGVQSRPGLLMCINGEEIRISRIGIYELKNGLMTTEFFSVCGRALDVINPNPPTGKPADIDVWTRSINTQIENKNYNRNDIKSQSFVSSGYKGIREIPKFTLDYLYRDEN